MNRAARSAAPAAAVLAVACAVLFGSVLRHPHYTPDGMVYARYAAHDAGYSEHDASLAVRHAYEHTPLMNRPRYRKLVEIDPDTAFAQSAIFSNRILYSAAAAALYPLAGVRALFIVSAISYAAFALCLYWLLASFGRPWAAAVLSAIGLLLPETRAAAASDLTDMFALVWWTLALVAIVRGTHDLRPRWVLLLAAASILLTLTRPAPYLTIVPALAAGIAAGAWPLLAGAFAGAAAFLAVAAFTHAFGVAEQLRWVYTHRPDAAGSSLGEGAWYRRAISSTLAYGFVEGIRAIWPAAGLGAWIYALRIPAARTDAVVIGAAGLAVLLGVPFNPVPSALDRVIFLPLVPLACASAACALRAV
ncbi:MAG TPA: hypothetical protein VFA29_11815 [Candidatus Baltobacteraceae bacterium]|nr:hypothetical protein [Candidatus Baltobacteraceae bacterium]